MTTLLPIDYDDPVIPDLARTAHWHTTLARMLMNGWTRLDCGRHRTGYARGNIVIKIPINDYGLSDNDHEARVYKQFKNKPDMDGVCYARCRLLDNGWLMMVKVSRKGFRNPSWAGRIDCAQVGMTVSGKIVAYDYGVPGT